MTPWDSVSPVSQIRSNAHSAVSSPEELIDSLSEDPDFSQNLETALQRFSLSSLLSQSRNVDSGIPKKSINLHSCNVDSGIPKKSINLHSSTGNALHFT